MVTSILQSKCAFNFLKNAIFILYHCSQRAEQCQIFKPTSLLCPIEQLYSPLHHLCFCSVNYHQHRLQTVESHYSLLVPTNAHIVLIYVSPYLAPRGFDWSPSSGTSQPNSLKLTAISSPYNAMHVNVHIMLKFTLHKY
jgi:hypothetical protein